MVFVFCSGCSWCCGCIPSWASAGAQPCGARRAERLGRSGGRGPRRRRNAGRRRRRLRRDFVLGNLSARDARAPVSTSGSRSRWGNGCAPGFPSPASRTRDARQSLSTAASAPGNKSPGFHLPLRTPSPCPSPARDAGFGVPLDRSGSHAAPPSRCSAPVRFPAGRSSPASSLLGSAGDRPPAPPPAARNERCAAGSTASAK